MSFAIPALAKYLVFVPREYHIKELDGSTEERLSCHAVTSTADLY